ncbi:SIR2 family protein [Phaeobacter gallaeciensis]|uniref:SIR2 family protein n=1 Tax=Phaeobacter gallaeciensis TaxID=60890 RepID=UPI00237F20D5|nr:SIR2 family protein [Phaeobacter gallaeciensis]MDE4304151.1 SIR2 family protein [Phaeobacter gallaeciensis]MDE4310596.1 SIR2 family protein [Phaeobacter gallaeciensis]MDE4315056.1 SIR2 family protein [Phaeobacter gallaeciensis]MDE4319524.1 SIR2 family protein [Phaeobacter gallaeciensis]MDE4323947.1 SIR2 family protein [Phaeobacter gallaeciensis]
MSAKSSSLPPALLSAIKDQRAVLFLGAGASLEARDRNRKKPPTGDGLRDLICDKFFEGSYKDYDLASASEFAFEQHGNLVVNEFIKNIFEPFLPSKPHLSIPNFKWAAIATTNYDTLIEKSYKAKTHPLQTPVSFVSNQDPVDIRMRAVENSVEYLKLHGCIERAHDVNLPLILSVDSYDLSYPRKFGQ